MGQPRLEVKMKIGFTGTQLGITAYQEMRLYDLLTAHFSQDGTPNEFHHGDCIGADAQAHDIALEIGYDIYIHPPEDTKKEAFKTNYTKKFHPKPYLERNKDIVDATVFLIAVPKPGPEHIRSGTWSTIRYARSIKRRMIIL